VPLVVRDARRVLRLGTETIKTGALVYVPIYAVHRHEEFWDRPDVFDPDRFAPEAAGARGRYVYLPFGAGPRPCAADRPQRPRRPQHNHRQARPDQDVGRRKHLQHQCGIAAPSEIHAEGWIVRRTLRRRVIRCRTTYMTKTATAIILIMTAAIAAYAQASNPIWVRQVGVSMLGCQTIERTKESMRLSMAHDVDAMRKFYAQYAPSGECRLLRVGEKAVVLNSDADVLLQIRIVGEPHSYWILEEFLDK
jgi:Cytochrome P450